MREDPVLSGPVEEPHPCIRRVPWAETQRRVDLEGGRAAEEPEYPALLRRLRTLVGTEWDPEMGR